MLAAIAHTCTLQAMHQTFGQQTDIAGIAAESAITNDAAFAIVQIKNGRET